MRTYKAKASNCNSVENSIGIAKEQLEGILNALHMKHSIVCEYVEYHPAGANFYGITHFTAEINGITYKTIDIKYHPAAETGDEYINKVKSYLLDVLDGAINL